LNFTTPAGVVNPVVFTGAVTGTVSGSTGSVAFSFANPVQSTTFSGGNGSGNINVSLDQTAFTLTLGGIASQTLTATISSDASVSGMPEPGSIVLMGTGVGLLVFSQLRRRQARS
jgi:hypothetical protein